MRPLEQAFHKMRTDPMPTYRKMLKSDDAGGGRAFRREARAQLQGRMKCTRAPAITRVASIGGGPIGGGWTAHFLARGYDVTSYLHDPAELPAFRAILDTAWGSLTALGLAPGASLDRLTVVRLEEAR